MASKLACLFYELLSCRQYNLGSGWVTVTVHDYLLLLPPTAQLRFSPNRKQGNSDAHLAVSCVQ